MRASQEPRGEGAPSCAPQSEWPSADAEERRSAAPHAAAEGGAAVRNAVPDGGRSLTAPVQFTEGRFAEFRGCGVDSLDLALDLRWGPTWDSVQVRLEKGKSAACGTGGVLFGDDGACLIRPSGKPPLYPWHLQWAEFHLFLSPVAVATGETPNAFVSLNSETLWRNGILPSVELVRNRLKKLGGVLVRSKPSRCDLCADYYIPGGLTLDFLRSRRIPQHYKNEAIHGGYDLETFYFGGKGSPIKARIYDKGKEILRNGSKLWFLEVWKVESVADIWRTEFQIRREVLRKFGINSLEDLTTAFCALWDYSTGYWFTLREPDNDHVSRRTMNPWWQHVQSLGPRFGERKPLVRRATTPMASVDWYVSHIAGCVKAIAARRGKLSRDEALDDVMALLKAKLEPTQFAEAVRVLSIQLGIVIGQPQEESPQWT
jgi:hypothetical protein